MNRDFIKIIDGAKAGDNSAFEDLYNMTKKSAYFIAYSITKNEQDAMDIMQDSYIKAFNNIDSLRQPEVFDSWLNSIVSNNSKNYIAKKKPMLFGNITEDIDDVIGEEVLADNSNSPAEIVDNKETSKIIMDIIDGLSEDKRLIVIMYYYQEMLVKEIASTLNLPVTTVKYKLLSARQDMKKDIERLEKKGTKLYSNAPLAIISSGLVIASSSFEVPTYASVLSGVITGGTIVGASTSAVTSMAVTKSVVATSGTVAGGAASTSGTVAGGVATTSAVVSGAAVKGGVLATVGGKIAAATLAITIAGGGTVAVVTHHNENENKTTISNESIQLDYDETLENITSNIVSEGEDKYYEELEVNGEVVVKAYSYVPTVYNRGILPTAYQDKKVEFNDLPNEVKLINVFRNIKFNKEDIVFSVIDGREQGGWIKSDDGSEYPSGFYSFDESLIHKTLKEIYGEKATIMNDNFKISCVESCQYHKDLEESGVYSHGEGGSGYAFAPVSFITKAYIEDDELHIFDKFLQFEEIPNEGELRETEYKIYKSTVGEAIEVIKDENINIFDKNIYEYVKMKYVDKMAEYKHTFKKNDNGEFYWVSTEPIE